MPNYNIYFTPSDVGIYNLEAKIIDHTGYSTTTSSYRIRVTNGEPPVIELLAPRTGESFALDYDRNQDIRLIAKLRILIGRPDSVVMTKCLIEGMSLTEFGSLRIINLLG